MDQTFVGRWLRRWRLATTPYEAREPLAGRFRAQQLRAAIQLMPWMMAANVIMAVVIAWFAHFAANQWLLLAWAGAITVMGAAGLRPWARLRQGTFRDTVSSTTLDRVTRNVAMLGALWGTAPAWLYPIVDTFSQKLILGVVVGMLGAGSFALSSMPRAAIAYVSTMGTGLSVGLMIGEGQPVWALLLVGTYLFVVITSTLTSARNLGRRLMAEAEAARQTELVGLLLNDFEENSSDWLWEIDRAGLLDHISVRLSEAFCRPPDALMGAHFVELIISTLVRPNDEERQAVETLRHTLAVATPFRDVDVPVLLAGQRQWWSLSGKPLLDDDGQLIGWRGVGSDVTRRRHDHAEMSRLANFDALTGLANRHQFQTRLLAIGERPCTLFYLDLDNFKGANDFHGHAVGDRVLQVVASRFLAQIRYGDLLARLGGDEFALISWNAITETAAADLATRLIDTLREPLAISGHQIQVSTSIGIVRSTEAAGGPEDLLKFADMALYAAKDAGRTAFRFFQPDMNENARRRLSLVNDLHAAVKHQQFELYFQPLVHLRSGEVVSAEALIRWHHPQRGMVPPIEFISLAEESSLILPIGAWVLEEACRRACDWPAHVKVAVNLSAVQFLQRDLVDAVANTLARTGLPAERLELEITESLLIEDSLAARTALQGLRRLGVRIALDDFGTGYSSLAYLRSFPLDKLKIDGSFVRSLTEDRESYAIVRTIVQLAKALRLDITAECVETREQFDTLHHLGCTDAQGYWMGRPMTADALMTVIQHWEPIRRTPPGEQDLSVNSRMMDLEPGLASGQDERAEDSGSRLMALM